MRHLVARIAGLFKSAPPALPEGAIVVRVDHGRSRAAAVAAHMAAQASALRMAWAAGDNPVPMLQAGAAASQTMADLLHAALSNDAAGFKTALAEFVNDAVDTGGVRA